MPTTTRKSTKTTPGRAPADHAQKYAPTQWGTVGQSEDLEMPSGQLALVRRPGLQKLMQAGVLNNMDVLTKIVQSDHVQKTGAVGMDQITDLLNDPQKIDEMMRVIDKIVVYCVVQPELHMTPDDVTNRVPGRVYADQVELDDKMFIFQFAMGGTRDLDRFRKESEVAVGSLGDVKDVEGTAE